MIVVVGRKDTDVADSDGYRSEDRADNDVALQGPKTVGVERAVAQPPRHGLDGCVLGCTFCAVDMVAEFAGGRVGFCEPFFEARAVDECHCSLQKTSHYLY